MKKNKMRLIYISVISSLLLSSVVGCGKKVDKVTPSDTIKSIKIEQGAVIMADGDILVNLNGNNGEYAEIDENVCVVNYNQKSKRYVFLDKDEYKFWNGKEDKILEKKGISKVEISPAGTYISYFRIGDRYDYIIKKSDTMEEIKLNIKGKISGDLVSFYDDNTIVYYGIGEDKKNGIFTYSIDKGVEKLIYEVEEGFITYLKSLNKDIAFLVQSLSGGKQFVVHNKATGDNRVIQTDLSSIVDVEMRDENIYVLGKAKTDTASVFKIGEDDNAERILYDYPKEVISDKGLSKDKDENILFMGFDENGSEEELFYIDNEDSIGKGNIKGSSVEFIEVN